MNEITEILKEGDLGIQNSLDKSCPHFSSIKAEKKWHTDIQKKANNNPKF